MTRQILIVDDEKDLLDLTKTFFETFDFDVAVASSGEEALAILEHDSFGVIFLDLKMPGMDGVELCKLIRERDAEVTIYAVTGYHEIYPPEACRQAGFDDYFNKPVSLHLLHNAALRAFEKHPG
ncbi:MAG: response regulator [Deltaproteobacteria bacterium]|nr:response regulator [Deltaproteobacteria bacterium]